MYKRWKTATVVLILGFVIPGMMLNRVSKSNKTENNTEALQETLQEQSETVEIVSQEKINISVLDYDDNVINIDLEEYVTCVVLAEMPASFEIEALKAQAVVVRTYTLRRLNGNSKHPNANVCKKPSCCQSFCSVKEYLDRGGNNDSIQKVSSAVEDTAGLVLTYGGELVEATYFSCSGGITEDAAAAWGEDIPYLQSTISPGEEHAANYVRTVNFSLDEFAYRLGIKLNGRNDGIIGDITYTSGQGVDTIEVDGNLYKGTQIRSKLGLNSTAFVITIIGDTVVITTRGYGHRVGMSQYGANSMASEGYVYDEILKHHYKGINIMNNL